MLFYVTEKWVTARPRSKRLRKLGFTAAEVTENLPYSAASDTETGSTRRNAAANPYTQQKTAAKAAAPTAKPDTPTIGQSYFDNKLNMPLWWDGQNWVDYTGAKAFTCSILGNESTVLEASSLVVEIPGNNDITVTMNQQDITRTALDERIVTIPYVTGDITITTE